MERIRSQEKLTHSDKKYDRSQPYTNYTVKLQ